MKGTKTKGCTFVVLLCFSLAMPTKRWVQFPLECTQIHSCRNTGSLRFILYPLWKDFRCVLGNLALPFRLSNILWVFTLFLEIQSVHLAPSEHCSRWFLHVTGLGLCRNDLWSERPGLVLTKLVRSNCQGTDTGLTGSCISRPRLCILPVVKLFCCVALMFDFRLLWLTVEVKMERRERWLSASRRIICLWHQVMWIQTLPVTGKRESK